MNKRKATVKLKPQRPADRIWDVVERVRVCMMTTRFSAGLRARPLEARPHRDEGTIWFLTDGRQLVCPRLCQGRETLAPRGVLGTFG